LRLDEPDEFEAGLKTMKPVMKKIERRGRRKKHVRKHVMGTPQRPRLTVFRSNKNIYAQIVDDIAGQTLASASTQQQDIAGQAGGHCGNKQAASVVGQTIAAKAGEKGITEVVFDRNGYPYHGRVKELADAARKGGLKF
jgi:large subunit ribosomal protein L18